MPQSNKAVLQLLRILRAETDAGHRLTAPMLLERLTACGIHAERRSIYRAIAALRQCGIPIEKTTTGYYYAHTAAENDAYAALAAAVEAAGFLSSARKQALLEHIKTQAGPCASESALSLSATISGPSTKDDALFIALQCASHAISGGTQLTFLFSTSESERLRVNPYALAFQEGIPFLLCNKEGEPGLSCFPLASLLNLREEQQPRRHFSEVSPYKVRFDVEDALRHTLGKEFR